MSHHLERAQLLINQHRFEMAQEELAQALATDPDNGIAHYLMAICFRGQDDLESATREIQQAIHLQPDSPRSHAFLGSLWIERNHYEKAQASLDEALRLDPFDANTFAYLSHLNFEQKRWEPAVEFAEKGLGIDPDHAMCESMLALALERSGRKDLALQRSRESLQKNPDDSYAHATHGWGLLNDGQYKAAQESFRESLRIDPSNELAKQGMIQALNSNNFVFRMMFKWYSFMGRLSGGVQWGIILGLYFGNRILNAMAVNNPGLKPFVMPITFAYVAFAVMTWVANPLFNSFLRLNKFGKFLLNKRQVMASNFVLGFLALGIVLAVISLPLAPRFTWVLCLVYGLGMVIPISGTFNCPEGWPFNLMASVTIGIGLIGLLETLSSIIGFGLPGIFFLIFVLGVLGSQFLANYLASVTVKR